MLAIPWRERISSVNRVAVADLPLGGVNDDLAPSGNPTEPFLGCILGIALGWMKRTSPGFALAFVLPKTIRAFPDVTSFCHIYL
jgi:hypothetical protein